MSTQLSDGVCDQCGAPCDMDPRWRFLDHTAHHQCEAGYQAAGHNGRWIHKDHYAEMRRLVEIIQRTTSLRDWLSGGYKLEDYNRFREQYPDPNQPPVTA